MNISKEIVRGVIKENPTFILLLGMCPTLATTTSAFNGMGMGFATLFVLALSNMAISMVKDLIPAKVRIPSFIVIIASFVTMVDLLMAAYLPALHSQLGIFIPLIVVNCIVLGRAEAYASKNDVFSSLIDGIGVGLGFTLSLTVLGAVRELLGDLSLFGVKLAQTNGFWFLKMHFISNEGWLTLNGLKLIPLGGMLVFVLAPGAFIALAYLMVLFNRLKRKYFSN
ncbi:electron transport complex subunit RsxE [Williamwhitmania taraxaci]|uniref:Ion-translocating oxidoreductase complex subunit E n=1 Tax=Williamwhitmania taraxaci TaxID=1640674 RepID=A0A1G6SKS2_9BACT|nr:electron transport complex subunit E [Williamwhitmania taraxaci]SDD17438.1 electron transport complex protein RnfE [Williamwhitmania taraxaci]